MNERERDLLTSNHGVFRFEDRAKVMTLAEAREQRGEAWIDIVRDFHAGEPKYWGFRLVPYGHPDSKRQKTDAEIRSRDIVVFLWTALQSLVIIKVVIMYFGLNYSIESDDGFGGALLRGTDHTSGYGWGLAVSLVISFGALLSFAIRKSRGREWG